MSTLIPSKLLLNSSLNVRSAPLVPLENPTNSEYVVVGVLVSLTGELHEIGDFPFARVSKARSANLFRGEKYVISSPVILLEKPGTGFVS